MRRTDTTDGGTNDKGFALIAVLFVMAVLFILSSTLLFQSHTQRVVSVNESDYLAAHGYAEAGMAWAEKRIVEAPDLTDVLIGPDDDPAGAPDNFLLGMRDLRLSATTGFSNANEATASAIVQRDFGFGRRTYEAIRIPDPSGHKALVYVRVDDNYDDDPTDPRRNDPLVDTDNLVRVTVVSEFPVFVDGSGVEQPNAERRGRATRTLQATFGTGPTGLPAVATNGYATLSGSPAICGSSGSVHANRDLTIGGSICEDATAVGLQLGSATVGGIAGGGRSFFELPFVNPYDDFYVPALRTFDTSGSGTAHLRCNPPSTTDPGNAKYFALIADDAQGLIFKAYWDFINNRWMWREIDDLSGSTNVRLDSCGRAPGDAGYVAANAVDDGADDEFYGFRLAAPEAQTTCLSGRCRGRDSLCDRAKNDFGPSNGKYYEAPTGVLNTTGVSGSNIPSLPGGLTPDGGLDYSWGARVSAGNWTFDNDTSYSPLHGAVLFVYGNVEIGGDPGKTGSPYCRATGCSSVTPNGAWKASFLSYGDIEISGDPNLGPVGPVREYPYLLISGRDIHLAGEVNSDYPACNGSCPGPSPSAVTNLAGIIAAHEQVRVSGDPELFGPLLSEDAIDCSDRVVAGDGVLLDGNPRIYYDGANPGNPWAARYIKRQTWEEVP